jgi:hypothetical protein
MYGKVLLANIWYGSNLDEKKKWNLQHNFREFLNFIQSTSEKDRLP